MPTVYRGKDGCMFRKYVLLATLLLLLLACNKDNENLSNGNLIGYDKRYCASPFCGGWFIDIEGDTLRFLHPPEQTEIEITSQMEFPVPVVVEWRRYQNEWKDIEDLIEVIKLSRP